MVLDGREQTSQRTVVIFSIAVLVGSSVNTELKILSENCVVV